MFPDSVATIALWTVSRSTAGPRRERRLRVDERLARRRDPARRLRGSRLARGPADRRRPGDRAGRVGGAARRRRCSACASGSASPARRSACPPWSSPTSACAEDVLGRGATERVAEGGMPALLERCACGPGAPVDPLDRAAALAMARRARADLALALGVSERQLRRRFLDAVGYGPKTLARVLRFQRFLELGVAAAATCAAGAGRRATPTRRTSRARAGVSRGARRPSSSRPARARGRTCPFRSSGRRAGRVPSGGIRDDRQSRRRTSGRPRACWSSGGSKCSYPRTVTPRR